LDILVVEDNPGDAALLRRYLNAGGVSHAITNVERVASALELLRDHSPDVVLLDLSLPDSQGLATFNEVRVRRPDLPIIVLTGLDDQELATEAVKAGAQDYLVKGKIDADSLARSIRYAIERNRMQQELQALALRDELTGLLNRRGFEPIAEQQLRVAERAGTDVALLFCDVDGLKRVNDELGHPTGSRLIIDAADAIRAAIRQSDVPARYGGDEFCVMLVGGGESAEAVVERIAREVDRFNETSSAPYTLSLSIGTAVSTPGSRPSLGRLLSEADDRMYREKRSRQDRRAATAVEATAQDAPVEDPEPVT
jgi:diguanylate cyclase (GGDEF)-like protein